MTEIIAYVTIASGNGDQTDRIPITAEDWDNPLPRSIVWGKIEEAVNYAREYRTPGQKWMNYLRKQIEDDDEQTNRHQK